MNQVTRIVIDPGACDLPRKVTSVPEATFRMGQDELAHKLDP